MLVSQFLIRFQSRSLDEGWMGELGPMRIPTSQEFTRALIRRFNLVTSKFQAR